MAATPEAKAKRDALRDIADDLRKNRPPKQPKEVKPVSERTLARRARAAALEAERKAREERFQELTAKGAHPLVASGWVFKKGADYGENT